MNCFLVPLCPACGSLCCCVFVLLHGTCVRIKKTKDCCVCVCVCVRQGLLIWTKARLLAWLILFCHWEIQPLDDPRGAGLEALRSGGVQRKSELQCCCFSDTQCPNFQPPSAAFAGFSEWSPEGCRVQAFSVPYLSHCTVLQVLVPCNQVIEYAIHGNTASHFDN